MSSLHEVCFSCILFLLSEQQVSLASGRFGLGDERRSCLCRQAGICFLEAWSLGGNGDQWTPGTECAPYIAWGRWQAGRTSLWRLSNGLEPRPRIPSFSPDSQAWNGSCHKPISLKGQTEEISRRLGLRRRGDLSPFSRHHITSWTFTHPQRREEPAPPQYHQYYYPDSPEDEVFEPEVT